MSEWTLTLAEAIKEEEEALRRRFIHHTRPKGPISLKDAMELAGLTRSPTSTTPAETARAPAHGAEYDNSDKG